jgi:hypothetical protein
MKMLAMTTFTRQVLLLEEDRILMSSTIGNSKCFCQIVRRPIAKYPSIILEECSKMRFLNMLLK